MNHSFTISSSTDPPENSAGKLMCHHIKVPSKHGSAKNFTKPHDKNKKVCLKNAREDKLFN